MKLLPATCHTTLPRTQNANIQIELCKMQKQTKQISSIGDIGLTKADTTLFFNKQSVPATVVDEKGNLICFYAKQVMEEHSINDTKENQLLDSVNAVRSSIEPHRAADFKPQCYWYFFSPLYFGESPVACVTSSQWQYEDGAGKIVPIYTFKRMFSSQPHAKITGYFGGELLDCHMGL
jgi:hypothetical protein